MQPFLFSAGDEAVVVNFLGTQFLLMPPISAIFIPTGIS